MRLVFSNAVILEGEDLEVTRGYLVVKDQRIEEISEGSPARRAIDLKGGIVMPPFVNAHTHVGDSVGKELYLGRTQPEVVGSAGIKFQAMDTTPRRSAIASIRATLRDMLRTGTIVHCDFRERGSAGVDLLKKASCPPMQTLVLSSEESFNRLREILTDVDGVGLPSLNTLESEELQEISKVVRMTHKFLAVHVAETKEAQEFSLEKMGKSEVERALTLKPSFVVHATHSSTEDLKLLARKKVPVVFCPRANQLLGVGIPPIKKATELGVEFWFGTDNVMVTQPDLFEELHFAWACLRREDQGAGADEARRLLVAAALAPVKRWGLRGGPLLQGGEATFLVLSRKNNLMNISNIHAGIVNRARADNIRAFFVAGKSIFR
jgi:cytosine/adenosine deaminase-related metal-dependent hydrolase